MAFAEDPKQSVMLNKHSFFLSFLLMLLMGCQSSNGEYDDLAKDLCTCMRPIADMNTKVKNLLQQQKMAEVQALFSQLEQLSEDGEACTKNLELKYGVIEGEQEIKANQAMAKHCPDIAKMIEQSKAMEQ